jgi:MFS transporter, FSR family, fosmidomycin resistance protein
MTDAIEIGTFPRARESRAVGLVCGAHLVSHVHLIVLPPLFAFIRADYGVSYAELGFLVAAFNIVSTVLQAPAGFLVDRIAPGWALVLALVVGASGLALAAAVPLYWGLLVGWLIVGVANTIYHPADYAILADAVGGKRIGQAFSIHTFFGMLGTAVTPAAMLFLADRWGWHGALMGAALLGYVVGAALLLQRGTFPSGATKRAVAAPRADQKSGWRLLLSRPILRNVMFFVLMSAASSGISNFSIVALGAFHGAALGVANLALTAFLATSAAGVLAGGLIAMRTRRHDKVAIAGFCASAVLLAALAVAPLGATAIISIMAVSGFLSGMIQPSRDMMVRAVTPEGSFGKVFGFVSVGFSIGGMIGPLIYGWLMDANEPRLVFVVVVLFTLLALLFVRVPAAETKASS